MLESSMGGLILSNTWETVYMTLVSTGLAYLVGLPLGVLLVVTAPDGLHPMRIFNRVLSFVVNILRSVPFLILMIALIPVARFLVGTSIGAEAAIVSLVVASAPFIGRLVEGSLREVDPGVIEAMQSMGATNMQIIFKAMLVEALPSLISGAAIACTTILSYGAMAGAIGAGGLGKLAINYGYNRYQYDVMMITVAILVLLVQIIQAVGNLVAARLDKRK